MLVVLALGAPAGAVEAQAAAPGAPTITSVKAGNQQVVVSWQAPSSEGGSAITGYVVTPIRGSTKQPAIRLDSPDTKTTVKGLANNAPYKFTVAAVNGQGTGKASAESTTVTPHGPGTSAWYKQKRWWAAGLVVLIALIVIAVFAFRPKKPKPADAPTVAEPTA